MSTIPMSAIVNVIPSALSAGGNALVMNGLQVHRNSAAGRIPTNTVMSFASATAVGAYFGTTSEAYSQAVVYFSGFIGSTQLPGAMLAVNWPEANEAAWLKSGKIVTLTIGQIQAITGPLTVVVDGYPRVVASVNLSGATSYTAAAGLLATALNTSPTSEAVSAASGGTIVPVSTAFTGSISDQTLFVTSAPSNPIVPGTILSTAGGVTTGTQILDQISGTAGGIGEYSVSIVQGVPSGSFTGTYGTLTLAGSNASGTFSVGQTISGGTTSAGTAIFALGTGVGAAGTYFVSPSQTVSTPATITATYTLVTVTFDVTSGSFIIQSGITGSPSTMAFATGSAATALLMTAATGAVLSQGANGVDPVTFMNSVVQETTNWATFWNILDPDDFIGNTNKLAFAAWNSAQNSRYTYLVADTDVTPTLSTPATSSFGYLVGINGFNYNGVYPIWDTSNLQPAFIAGTVASINFNAVNGRTTIAFRNQAGLLAGVTNQQVAANLLSNGYSFYGAYATANQTFVWQYNGAVSGEFLWLDSFVNQIYFNAQFQLAFATLLNSVGAIPYNNTGYGMILGSMQGVINQMLNFGAIQPGVPLSAVEAITVNNQAGVAIDGILSTRGWYAQVQPATPQIRAARQSPVIFLWYTDGGSIQQITLNSVDIE